MLGLLQIKSWVRVKVVSCGHSLSQETFNMLVRLNQCMDVCLCDDSILLLWIASNKQFSLWFLQRYLWGTDITETNPRSIQSAGPRKRRNPKQWCLSASTRRVNRASTSSKACLLISPPPLNTRSASSWLSLWWVGPQTLGVSETKWAAVKDSNSNNNTQQGRLYIATYSYSRCNEFHVFYVML